MYQKKSEYKYWLKAHDKYVQVVGHTKHEVIPTMKRSAFVSGRMLRKAMKERGL
jgi:hypothetical protein